MNRLGCRHALTGGLVVLGTLSAVLAWATARRFYARYQLSATALTGRELGWTGPRSIELDYWSEKNLRPLQQPTG